MEQVKLAGYQEKLINKLVNDIEEVECFLPSKVVGMIGGMGLSNIYEALKDAKWDETVGIKIVKLTGNDSFAFYAAEIDAYKRVGAHYHTEGIEVYQVIEGKGNIYIGSPKDEGDVDWKQPVNVKAGDCFTVNPHEVYQLINISSERLVIVFACPFFHISTDRVIVNGVGC